MIAFFISEKIVFPLNWSRYNLTWRCRRRYDIAVRNRVSSIAFHTQTRRWMIDYIALGVYATSSRTWVLTFIVAARSTFRAVAICHTFWTTFNIWITIVLRQASTKTGTILFPTNSICTARTVRTRISLFFDYWNVYVAEGCLKTISLINSGLSTVPYMEYLWSTRRTDHR